MKNITNTKMDNNISIEARFYAFYEGIENIIALLSKRSLEVDYPDKVSEDVKYSLEQFKATAMLLIHLIDETTKLVDEKIKKEGKDANS